MVDTKAAVATSHPHFIASEARAPAGLFACILSYCRGIFVDKRGQRVHKRGRTISSMKRLAILVLAFATALTGHPQRASGHPGFAFHSSPVAHSAPVFRGGVAMRSSTRPLFTPRRAYAVEPPHFAQPSLRPVTVAPSAAPRFYQKRNVYRNLRHAPTLPAIAYSTSVVGFLPDSGFYDDSWNDLSYPSAPTALQQPDESYNGYPDYGAEYAQYPPAPEAPPLAEVQSTSENPETVTLIFNNGQPPEQIQNYLATSTTLTVIDGTRHRDIPVAELDIPATIKANHAAGVDFSLPAATP